MSKYLDFTGLSYLMNKIKTLINNKADKSHAHAISDITSLQSTLDGKAASSHGTHVTWSTTTPKVNGTAAVGSETKVARGDHVHPTDTTRAAASDLTSHTGNKSNPHGVTASQVGLGNVPNVATNDQTPTFTQATTRANIASGEKLSVILGKIMKYFTDLKTVAFSGSYSDLSNKPTIPTKTSELTNDAGFKTTDTTYSAAGSSLGLVKTGGDVTISSGVITVNDDSHAHVISNVDGLQSALDGKAASGHTHNYAGSSSAGGAATSALTCTGNSATATTSSNSNGVNSTGFGNGNFTYCQFEGTFNGNSGWCHYLIANHGDGANYYNYTIGLPFNGIPMYQRQTGNTSARSGWHKFYTSENITYGTSALTPGSSGLSTGSIYLQYE